MSEFVATVSRRRSMPGVILSVIFTVAGLWMAGAFGDVPSSSRYSEKSTFVVGLLIAPLFGFTALLALVRLLRAGVWLRIGPEGIRYAVWQNQLVPWSAIGDVRKQSHSGRDLFIILTLRASARLPIKKFYWVAPLARPNQRTMGIAVDGTDRSFDEAWSAIMRFRPPSSSD